MNPADVDPFIASLRWPIWSAYVINKLVARFSCTRAEAVQAWDDHWKRRWA